MDFSQQHYRFSFTAASLMGAEMIDLATELVENDLTLDELSATSLNRARAKTNEREFKELKIRLKSLTEKELEALTYLPREERVLLCYIACIRVYRLFREFIDEVVLDNITIFKFFIDDLDYNTFFNLKATEYTEVDNLADSTRYKIKQVMFKIMEQAGLIDNIKDRNILLPYVSPQLKGVLIKDQWHYLFIS